LLRGEERAMSELYAIHAPRLLRFLGRFLRDPVLAEDVLQETFIAAFENIARARDVASLQAWLATIAVRKAMNLQRSSSRRVRIEGQNTRSAHSHPDHDTRDLAQRILLLIEGLDPEKRLVLLLASAGYSAAEIAEVTDEPRSTVLSRVARARIELAKLAAASGLGVPLPQEEPG
jgi:RNA polymerase sigma-70 factor (ECF subfamily)